MPRQILKADTRASHITRINAELTATGTRLGFDVSGLTANISMDESRDFRDMVYLKSESQAWAISVNISVRLIPCKEAYLGIRAECELGWGSTGRSVSQAVHVVTYYQRSIELAAAIEGLIA